MKFSQVSKVLLAFYAVGLLYGLLRPESPPDFFDHSDKLLHVLAFSGLACLTRIAYPMFSGIVLWLILMVLAPSLEALQAVFQPHRVFSVGDVVANVTGVLLGFLLAFVCQTFYQNKLLTHN